MSPAQTAVAGHSRIAYLLAALLGAGLALWGFPLALLVGALPPGAPPFPDFAQHVVGERYFLHQPWGWPPLRAAGLDAPHGVNIALTDSLPLLTLLAKAVRPLAPWIEQTETVFQALAWTLQPVAALFALRSAGERRLVPAIAVALIAASMPSFLMRFWQASLTGHFLILFELGFALRIVRARSRISFSRAIAAACLSLPVGLLTHPYLWFMQCALFASAPLTLAFRGDPRWRPAMAGLVAGLLASAALAVMAGYTDATGGVGGFGNFSMNLASPFWPVSSWLFPDLPMHAAEATPGQYEGYQYLGAGLLLLLGIAGLCCLPMIRRAASRHAGLVLVCLALTIFAVSDKVYLFHHFLFGYDSDATELRYLTGPFRCSGRMFWPVAYAAMVAAVVLVARRFPPALGGAILLLAGALQTLEARTQRSYDAIGISVPQSWGMLDAHRLDQVMAAHARLTVLPAYPCVDGGAGTLMRLLWIAADSRIPVDTMYVARATRASACLPTRLLTTPPEPGELRVLMPGYAGLSGLLQQDGAACRALPPYTLCSRDRAALAGLASPQAQIDDAAIPLGRLVPTRAGSAGSHALGIGWSAPEDWGVWSDGPLATIAAALPSTAMPPLTFSIVAHAFGLPAGQTRLVTVSHAGRDLAQWRVGGGDDSFAVPVPAEAFASGELFLDLHVSNPRSPIELHAGSDPRHLGIGIVSLLLSPASSPAPPAAAPR